MKKVFILGAGASRDLKFKFITYDGYYRTEEVSRFSQEGPLSLGFFYDAKKLYEAINPRIENGVLPFNLETISQNLEKYVCSYYQRKYSRVIVMNDVFNNKEVSDNVCIEDLYGEIEKETDNYNLSNELLDYYYNSLSLISYYVVSECHLGFAQQIVDNGDNIISFNWDTLLEEALYLTRKWDFSDGYGFTFNRILEKQQHVCPLGKNHNTTNYILKPHGSINWFSNNGNIVLLNQMQLLFRGGTVPQLLKRKELIDSTFYVSKIVPPGQKRLEFPDIWKQIKIILSDADEIVIIGFKFKPGDNHIEQEFKQVQWKNSLKVGIVDPKADEFIEKHKCLFRTDNVYKICSTFSDYCDLLKSNSALKSR